MFLQATYIPQILEIYIQCKYTYYKMYNMFPNPVPERARRNPSTDIFLPIIGSIYPIQTYKLYWHFTIQIQTYILQIVVTKFLINCPGPKCPPWKSFGFLGPLRAQGSFYLICEMSVYNLYVCIGYILPIIGRNMSVGGFLRALSGARLGNMYIL